MGARTAPSNGAIWNELTEEHQYPCAKQAPYSMPNLVHTRCKSNTLLGQGFLLKIRRKNCLLFYVLLRLKKFQGVKN